MKRSRISEESSLFTPAEKAALRLADAIAGDHKKAPYDEIFAELRKYYSEEQIVALGWKTGIWLGYGRLVHALERRARSRGLLRNSG